MNEQPSDAALALLLAECRRAVADPDPVMAHWGAYCRLVAFKLTNAVGDEQRQTIDTVLMRLRAELGSLARRKFARWQLWREDETRPRRAADEPPAPQSASLATSDAGLAYVYHGTVRGLLPALHLRGLRPEFSPDWRRGGDNVRCRVVEHWREAEVHAVLAHLYGPLRRVSAYWLPAILRLPVDPPTTVVTGPDRLDHIAPQPCRSPPPLSG